MSYVRLKQEGADAPSAEDLTCTLRNCAPGSINTTDSIAKLTGEV